jgi:DNA-directed RNA polymerase specialized sigma subunit
MGTQWDVVTRNGKRRVLMTNDEHQKNLENSCEKARQVSRLLLQRQAEVTDLAGQRRQAIAELRALGLSVREVAGVLGVSFSRVAQIEEDARVRPPSPVD